MKQLLLTSIIASLLTNCTTTKDNRSWGQIRTDTIKYRNEVCRKFIATLPDDFIKDWVEVPEDWNNPESLRIKVFYYGKIIPNTTPVVFFNGGPAFSSHAKYRQFAKKNLFDRQTLIMFDQRGNGCSTMYPSHLPANLGRYKNWTSRAIIRDAEKIRETIFPGQKWVVFGNSYGGILVRRYIEMFPASINRAISHGMSIGVNRVSRYNAQVKKKHQLQKLLLARYPAEAEHLLSQFGDYVYNNCAYNGIKKLCSYDYLNHLSVTLSYPSDWPLMIESLRAIFQEKDPDIRFQKFQKFSRELNVLPLEPDYETEWARRAIGHVDYLGDWPGTCWRNSKEYPYPKSDTDIFHPCFSFSKRDRIVRMMKKDLVDLKILKQQLIKNPELKFYIYAGELDGIMPPEVFKHELKYLDKLIHFKSFKDSGHDGYYTEPELLSTVFRKRNSSTISH